MSYLHNKSDRPVIGISIGDFNGIGPEIILKTLSDSRILKMCIPVVYGSLKVFSKYKKLLDSQADVQFFQIKTAEKLNYKKVNLINCWEEDYEISPGTPTQESGNGAFLALERMTNDIQNNLLDAIVTAPIHKANIRSEKFQFAGHTEYLGHKAGVDNILMIMASELMKVALATTHIALNQVPEALNKQLLENKLKTLFQTLKSDFGITKPKVALLGLNPHSGEDGLMGQEEQKLLIPFIEEKRTKGQLVFGPYPSDGFFGKQLYKKYDAVLAMYHDQGLAPFKALNFSTGVNFTAGLPFVRTSPDHGTAFDIAGKNLAEEDSFRQALFMACDIVKFKHTGQQSDLN
ncbi:4-hydroxythreonine-4-phosphate dehydrogenase PdxA [Cytophagaceae bacterium ABcell3]|nr:4-hydroxythreonine-4-phosphate dehydrogenase PdxA [Cytophagaceae bacterium ABcell3]